MKKFLSLLLLFCLTICSVYGAEFDTSIDENIRKEYLDDDILPPLPSAKPAQMPEGFYNSPSSTKTSSVKYNVTGKTYKIKKGTKVTLASRSVISDYLTQGSVVTFVSKTGFKTAEGTIVPAGTVFRARVTDSHRPQISSNGGLVELSINEICFNGISSHIETKLSNANGKKVFGGNIKGKHSYWSNCEKSLSPAKKYMNGAKKVERVFNPVPVLNLACSLAVNVTGAAVYAVNLVLSPVIALFSKGGSLRLPIGTEFKIKISETAEING